MKVVSVEQARRHRLRAHHLDRAYGIEDAAELAGACGMGDGLVQPRAGLSQGRCRAPAVRGEDARAGVEPARRARGVPRGRKRGVPVGARSGEGRAVGVHEGHRPCARCAGHGVRPAARTARAGDAAPRRRGDREQGGARSNVGGLGRAAASCEQARGVATAVDVRQPRQADGGRSRGVVLAAPVLVHGPRRVRRARRRNAHVHLVPKVDGRRAAAGR